MDGFLGSFRFSFPERQQVSGVVGFDSMLDMKRRGFSQKV